MIRKDARQRSQSTPGVRKVRGEIYRLSNQRAKRALKAGFYLEAIVLVESLMADRLESILAQLSGEPIKFRTANQAVEGPLRNYGADLGREELFAAIRLWSDGRSRWVHEFAKVSDQDHLTWRSRIADARRVATEGMDLVAEVTNEAKRLRRSASRVSISAQ